MKIQEVNEALGELLKELARCDENFCEEEARLWLMAATLKVWAGNRLFSEEYAKLLPVFKEGEYTVAQVVTALDCAGEENRELELPAFFQNIVRRDLEAHTSESREIADAIGQFLAQAALINGDFTLAEASVLRGISDRLLSYCDHQGVAADRVREYHPEMITPLS